jgi:hypothetical protein
MEQTVEFQSFRMRTFVVRGNGPCLWKGYSFMALKRVNVIVQRSRPAIAEAATRRQAPGGGGFLERG